MMENKCRTFSLSGLEQMKLEENKVLFLSRLRMVTDPDGSPEISREMGHCHQGSCCQMNTQ